MRTTSLLRSGREIKSMKADATHLTCELLGHDFYVIYKDNMGIVVHVICQLCGYGFYFRHDTGGWWRYANATESKKLAFDKSLYVVTEESVPEAVKSIVFSELANHGWDDFLR